MPADDVLEQLGERECVRGIELHAAIETAGRIRFLPIVLTTLTAIGGLQPPYLTSAAR